MNKTLNHSVMDFPANHAGIFVLGDVHGNYRSLCSALEYADDRNLFVVSLGDLVDYGSEAADCVFTIRDRMNAGDAAMVLGNHEFKNWKYFTQRAAGDIKVELADKHFASVASFDALGEQGAVDLVNFIETVPHIIEMENAGNRLVFAHAAVHRLYWELDKLRRQPSFSKAEKSIVASAFFGEIDHLAPKRPDGFPNRIYRWTEHVPFNATVFMGHDVMDGVQRLVSPHGGVTYQMDTGCSKKGYLSGVAVFAGKAPEAPIHFY